MGTKKLTYDQLTQKIKELEKASSSHRKTETALVESDKKYRDILENIEDGYGELNLRGRFIFANDYMFNILGYTKEELLTMRGWDVMDEENSNKVFRSFNEVYRTGTSSKGFDYEIKRKDGEKRQIEVSASLIMNDENQAIGFRSIVRDITERKNAERELRKARDELENRVRERTYELDEINRKLEVKTINLEEANTALRVLLKKKDETKKELEEKILYNIKELVIPVLLKLKGTVSEDRKQAAYISVLKNTLDDIISGFTRSLSSRRYGLTPTELQVAALIRQGKHTKEIASLMNLSDKTIETHRRNIRGKTGIKNQKVNLRTHLLTMN
jgi:PAS domain S-box-containing protein